MSVCSVICSQSAPHFPRNSPKQNRNCHFSSIIVFAMALSRMFLHFLIKIIDDSWTEISSLRWNFFERKKNSCTMATHLVHRQIGEFNRVTKENPSENKLEKSLQKLIKLVETWHKKSLRDDSLGKFLGDRGKFIAFLCFVSRTAWILFSL